MVFLELRRDSRVTTGNSGFLFNWPREVQFSFELRIRTGDCSRDTAGPNRPHLGLIKPRSPALQAHSLPSETPGKPKYPIAFIMEHSHCSPLLLRGRTPGIQVKLRVPLFHNFFFFFGQKMCKPDIAIIYRYLKSASIYSTHYKQVTGDPKSHCDKPFQGYGVRYFL